MYVTFTHISFLNNSYIIWPNFKGQEVHSHLYFEEEQYWILVIMSNAHHNDIFSIER